MVQPSSFSNATEAEWERFKPEIEKIYLHDDKTLLELMRLMESNHKFYKTRSQYERRLKRWNFRKYRMGEANWKFVARRMDKRRRVGKNSEVAIDGVLRSEEYIRKGISSQGFLLTAEKYNTAASPATPAGIDIRTPQSAGVRNVPLPWLQFLAALNSEVRQVDSAQDEASFEELTSLSPNDIDELIESIISGEGTGEPSDIERFAQVSAVLRAIMPGDLERQNLIDPTMPNSSKEQALDLLKVELFLLSNDFTFHDPDTMTPETLELHDKRLIRCLHVSGLIHSHRLEALMLKGGVTALVIGQKVFACALRTYDLELVETLLKLKISPDVKVDAVVNDEGIESLSPLQFAATISDPTISIRLANILLLYNAKVNCASYCCSPALMSAIERNNHELAETLLTKGAILENATLRFAVLCESITITNMLIQAGANVNDPETMSNTALCYAVRSDNLDIVKLILEKGADVNQADAFCPLCGSMSPLSWAAQNGNVAVVELLLKHGAAVNPSPESAEIAPLRSAVKRNHTEVAQLLLKAGADIEVADMAGDHTLLEFASAENNIELYQLLRDEGATLQKQLKKGHSCASALFLAVKAQHTEIVRLLLSSGAPMDGEYGINHETVLAAAIAVGNIDLIQMLQSFGATAIEAGLRRIGNLDTAICLDENNLLEDILRDCGEKILAAAISDEDEVLAQYILDRTTLDETVLDQDADATNDSGIDIIRHPSLLKLAVHHNCLTVLEALVSRGARVTEDVLVAAVKRAKLQDDDGILHELLDRFTDSAPNAIAAVIRHKNDDLFKLLLDAGISPRGPLLPNDELAPKSQTSPQSVLEVAAETDNTSVLRILLESDVWDSSLTGRALVVAAECESHDCALMLVQAGANVNIEIKTSSPENSITALQVAVKKQDAFMVEVLVSAGADVNYLGKGESRQTALQIAVNAGNMKLIDMLLAANAEVNGPAAEGSGATALQIAAVRGYLEIAHKLIRLGADVNENSRKFWGRTSLEGAAEHGRIDMVQFLLNEGALIDGHGARQYHRAIEFARKSKHEAAARLLESYKLQE
ncbi:ankyrin repeat-containing domain protein [Aspergillus cavernicola]|uniref:Ankyrin repeat-containing domain protein n=1 Tax=Aspergillus cavernicola TaxID=176166 RepID=A0ABR4HF34_9EURO